jgi:hypothetical protein
VQDEDIETTDQADNAPATADAPEAPKDQDFPVEAQAEAVVAEAAAITQDDASTAQVFFFFCCCVEDPVLLVVALSTIVFSKRPEPAGVFEWCCCLGRKRVVAFWCSHWYASTS